MNIFISVFVISNVRQKMKIWGQGYDLINLTHFTNLVYAQNNQLFVPHEIIMKVEILQSTSFGNLLLNFCLHLSRCLVYL